MYRRDKILTLSNMLISNLDENFKTGKRGNEKGTFGSHNI